MPKVTAAEIRMYKMGTGDCFAIKFFTGPKTVFRMIIDAGTWQGTPKALTPYISNLKTYLGNYADVLIVTHEHKDHVHAFNACEDLFTDGKFSVGELWMSWAEKDSDSKVKTWKKDYGEKKKALGLASEKLMMAMAMPAFKTQFKDTKDGDKMFAARKVFSGALNDFAKLHLDFDETKKVYKGDLAGMNVVKNKIKKKAVRYFKPGNIISKPGNLQNVTFYVLGPPELIDDIRKEAGVKGESYEHNTILKESDAFRAAINQVDAGPLQTGSLPFDDHFFYQKPFKATTGEVADLYDKEVWRKIDYDWLFSAGSFALRMSGLTNNLSLALAIEIGENGKVLLFPGDAEYGSWASWHKIQWKHKEPSREDEKHFTEDLLNRTVFYKVAHHLSHNGTAQRLGLEMMKSRELTAMATLDYTVITDGWKKTMPNRAIIRELLERTKGRLMIQNEEGLYYDFNDKVPMTEKIAEARGEMSAKEKSQFGKDHDNKNPLYIQYRIRF